ncbi:MAG: endo-1,4-beta-xylanase, partial [Bacteroidales bacterium]|nr:endo-1,4-beta-xylanase [Bacteroidales bacterium]
MKRNSILLPFAALALLCAGCDDDKMDWGTPEGQTPISGPEAIPLSIQEQINNYDYLKNYVKQYQSRLGSNFILGLGMGLQGYMDDAAYRSVADGNFQMYTPGNAMKQGVMVKNDGTIDFSTVDKFLAMIPSDARVYGHNFIWHTQQNQTYLKSLIAPKMVVESEGGIANILAGDASDFDSGTSGGWGSWGSNKKDASVSDGGVDGSKAMRLENNGNGNAWDAQFAYTLGAPLKKDVTYALKFQARVESGVGELQFQYQNSSTYGSQGGYNTFSISSDWATYEYEFTVTEFDDVDRIILNFGKVGGAYLIDNIEFGEKQEDPMENILAGDASDFEGGTNGGWGSWGSNKKDASVAKGEGVDGSNSLRLENNGDGNAWDAQCAYTFDEPFVNGETYIIQFKARVEAGAGELQFQYQNGSTYGSQGGYNTFSVGTEWTPCEYEFVMGFDDANRIILNFGKVGGAYHIDNIKFGKKKDTNKSLKATKIYYEIMSPEAKYEALDNAMEQWIKGAFEHFNGDKRFAGWDVINEAIADGGGRRGINGVFGGSWTEDDVTYYDKQPTETETDGLNLNWSSAAGNQHFYWGYYMGMDYAVKAFEYSRKYADANGLTDLKLFYNDYNLETSPSKLAEVIEFVKDIDAAAGRPIVDGIGTQMHVQSGLARADIDAMFKTLAATGKLIRVTELDVAVNTASPSAAELE